MPCWTMRPLFEHQNLIGVHQRMDAVRDDQRRRALPARFERQADGRIRSAYPVRESESSKDHDGRVLHEHARDGDALLFCPPESVTPRSPTSVSNPWSNSVSTHRCWPHARIPTPPPGGAGARDGDVFVNGARSRETAPATRCPRACAGSAARWRSAGCRRGKICPRVGSYSRCSITSGALAAARCAQDAHRLPGPLRGRDVVQHLHAVLIGGQNTIFKDDIAPTSSCWASGGSTPPACARFRRCAPTPKVLPRSASTRPIVDGPRSSVGRVRDERDQRADRQRAALHQIDAHQRGQRAICA